MLTAACTTIFPALHELYAKKKSPQHAARIPSSAARRVAAIWCKLIYAASAIRAARSGVRFNVRIIVQAHIFRNDWEPEFDGLEPRAVGLPFLINPDFGKQRFHDLPLFLIIHDGIEGIKANQHLADVAACQLFRLRGATAGVQDLARHHHISIHAPPRRPFFWLGRQ